MATPGQDSSPLPRVRLKNGALIMGKPRVVLARASQLRARQALERGRFQPPAVASRVASPELAFDAPPELEVVTQTERNATMRALLRSATEALELRESEQREWQVVVSQPTWLWGGVSQRFFALFASRCICAASARGGFTF